MLDVEWRQVAESYCTIERQQLSELVSMLDWHAGTPNQLIFMADSKIKTLDGYFDASGKEYDPLHTVISVAGFLATGDQWKAFCPHWQRVLIDERIHNKRGNPEFHATEFHNLDLKQGRFTEATRWSQDKKDRVYQTLINIINNNTFHPIGAGILIEDYHKFIDKNPTAKTFFLSAAAFAAQLCFESAAFVAQEFDFQQISYVFEAGDEYRSDIDALHAHLCKLTGGKELYRLKGGALTWEPKNLPPLQAADVLAWEMTKDVKELLKVDPNNDHLARSFAKDLIRKREFEPKFYGFEDLQSFWNEHQERLNEKET